MTGKLGHGRSFVYLTYRDYENGLLLNELIDF
jgi:hypothetical protein